MTCKIDNGRPSVYTGNMAVETYAMLKQASSDDVSDHNQSYRWFKTFRDSRTPENIAVDQI